MLRSLLVAAGLTAVALAPVHAQTTTAKPTTTTAAPAKPTTPAPAATPTTTPATAATTAPKTLIDINSASESDLDALWGIGPVRAKAIIAGRPYKGKDDLIAKKIIPQNVYDRIKDQIIAKQK